LSLLKDNNKKNRFGYTVKEELSNTVTHSIGFILSIIGAIVVIVNACLKSGSFTYVVSSVIFGLSLMLMYSSSALFHGIKNNQLKRIFQKLDHCAIYILIAGSYTPFTLITLRENSGINLFIFIWTLALIGVLIEKFPFKNSFFVSMVLYIVMGWAILGFFQPLYSIIHINGLILLILGGLFYTFGIIFFAWHRIPFNHTIWHLFVLGGSVCHYISIIKYVIV
jgi:hemolysin III